MSPRARPCPLALALAAAMVLAAACSGPASSPRAGGGGGATTAPAGGGGSSSGPLTEAECMRLLDHYLDLAMAEKRATLPPEEVPTTEQVARIRLAMREEAKANCVGHAERARYDCAMRAQTTRGLGGCLTGTGAEDSR